MSSLPTYPIKNGNTQYPSQSSSGSSGFIGLTPSDSHKLRQPFTAEAVKFRIQGKKTAKGSVRVLTYIDSRLAAERLSDVDPNWTMSPLEFPAGTAADPLGRVSENLPVIAALTVKGITRRDVGQNAPGWKDDEPSQADDKHVKMAVSDAIKRAAVLFGVGAYLYTLGEQYINEGEYGERNGKPAFINAKGMARLKSEYKKLINSSAFKERFGEALSYGDEIAVSVKDSMVETASPAQDIVQNSVDTPTVSEKKAPDAQSEEIIEGDAVKQLVLGLAKITNRSVDAAEKWIDVKKNRNLAAKQALKKAAVDGAGGSDVADLLDKHIGAKKARDLGFMEHFIEAAKAAK